ncbi:MAG: FxsA family protein [Gammaproteobacteria bacterium]|nr:MAG: FxsA family protein [Gammaproteobacteria bacterium]
MGFWFLVFFLTPILEMYLLIEVGGYIGTLPTIALVMLTAVVGVALLRLQGVETLTRGVGRLQRGEVPATEMAEGILLAVAGALLITPGFVTDAVGFVLLFPPSRAAIARRMLSRLTVVGPDGRPFSPGEAGHGPTVIEGEFERRPPEDGRP